MFIYTLSQFSVKASNIQKNSNASVIPLISGAGINGSADSMNFKVKT